MLKQLKLAWHVLLGRPLMYRMYFKDLVLDKNPRGHGLITECHVSRLPATIPNIALPG